MTHTVPVERVGEWLRAETRNTTGDVAVLAGHFAIFTGGGAAHDLLDEPTVPAAGAAEMIAFTRLSLRFACEAAAAHADPFRIVTLVDDIQFVRPVVTDRATAERLGAALAAGYLDSVRELPAYHAGQLTAHDVSSDRILRCREDRWLFSERELRHAAVQHVRRHFDDSGGSGAGLTSADNGNTMTVSLPEQGDYCLVHSGHTTCAGGYVELLSTLFDRGVRKLVAFVPMRCFGQVALGTALARHLYTLPGFDVVNVGIVDPSAAPSVVVDRI